MIYAMHTPTFEATMAEAFEPLSLFDTTLTRYGLSTKGRGGKPALRIGTNGGTGLPLPPHVTSAESPLRVAFDVLFESLATGGFCRLVSGSTISASTNMELRLRNDGGLELSLNSRTANLLVDTGKKLLVNTVYTVEIECAFLIAATGFVKVWVDGELVLHHSGSVTNGQTSSFSWVRFDALAVSTTSGIFVSNILVHADEPDLACPLGPLDFAYVPVTDADLGETTTNDNSPFKTLAGSAYADYPLAADARPGAVIGYVPSIRARTAVDNPGALDAQMGSTVLGEKVGVAGGPTWANRRFNPRLGALPANAISLRNSPV